MKTAYEILLMLDPELPEERQGEVVARMRDGKVEERALAVVGAVAIASGNCIARKEDQDPALRVDNKGMFDPD